MSILKEFLKKLILKKIQQQQKHEQLPSMQQVENNFVNVISTITVNSEIFARVLFLRKFAYAKFCEKNSRDTANHSAVY